MIPENRGTWLHIILTIPAVLISLPLAYIALYHLAANNGYDGWRAALWPLVFFGLVFLIIRKVYVLLNPPKEEIVIKPLDYGIIYIMQRDDGILKFGKTIQIRERLLSHKKGYSTGFRLINTWIVPDINKYERLSLEMSSQYRYAEGKRLELRRMGQAELAQFVLDFTEKVYEGWAIAGELGVSLSTVRGDIKAISSNGNH